MKDSRRDFLKKAALLTGGAGIWSVLPASIEKAMAISPDSGTTFYNAEHVVLLMQENRSFDHCFGTLKGVRGYNDPRAISLPDKNPVWLQPDKNGNRFAPFRFDIKDTKATWMRDIPHSWENQVDARNEGKYNGWIEAKRSGRKEFRDVPMTMGYYSREDIPFYYALADAFTVCDQHFCASLTGTTTNRNYFWTGKTHANGEKAKVRNGEMGYREEVNWTTFPERLEDNGISWKVYQNEVSVGSDVEDSSLLANFTDNNLEWFTQFGVRFTPGHYDYLKKRQKALPKELMELERELKNPEANQEELQKKIAEKKEDIIQLKTYLAKWNPKQFKKLTAREQSLHQKAFTTNIGDPNYHKVETLAYIDNGESRETKIPKGDILHQFRRDVQEGKLPAVSWVVAPQKFSDHPSAPWYGAWYVSEVMDILTQNPEVWKKTIFILNYDENDGYFDHVPPFVAPNPNDPDDGKVSSGLDVTGEFVNKEEELKVGFKERDARTSPVGLGYRVPLVIASPWSRGGWVNSQVCDITSTIKFMEKWLFHKTGKNIHEPNISAWRREISGDLTSAFRPYNGEEIDLPEWVDRNQHVQQIYNAQFKELPTNFKALSADEAKDIGLNPMSSNVLPQQEPGTKPSNALKYELYADGHVSANGKYFTVKFKAGQDIFGEEAYGAPFNVYAPGNYWNKEKSIFEPVKTWAFAVKSGDELEYQWPLEAFEDEQYHLRVYGPNGYFREFMGNAQGPRVEVSTEPIKKKGDFTNSLKITISNSSNLQAVNLRLADDTYQQLEKTFTVQSGSSENFTLDVSKNHGWYDFKLQSPGVENFEVRYAGRLEIGKDSISDPFMGREI
ncbi:phospholipase C, phosphocholine-specific [Echinicola sp. CAU 1574]|uniref:phospholipase C n=1 Tax=Echinicola arenosa TaxID=2774144 RepID=A0ABR9AL75_9BACT|nr:phospholipase C, phosphocholine-specific [Echinicola arenosa]MBD8489555.1 phospholipase C, phosphocholine-specific [Echinicola arenosa]